MTIHIQRRDFLASLGLGAGAALLSPLLHSLVAQAQGIDDGRCNLVVFTDGNGWGHQGMQRSELLLTDVRSPSDWDLPSVLQPLSFIRERISIALPLENPFGRNLHGNGWATLNVMPTVGGGPGGVSLDRWVALQAGLGDAFPSLALGVATRNDRPAPCTSSDGPAQPFPAIASPVAAFEYVFGTGTVSGVDPKVALARERSLLDAMIDDVKRARDALAGPERAKFDQLLESYRTVEQSLAQRLEIFESRELPPPPDPALDEKTGLEPDVIRAHVDLIALALSFGLTHVAHLSVLGFDAHNAGWGALGHPGDAHEDIAHVAVGGEAATDAYRAIISYKAGELAHLYQQLEATSVGDATLAERTVFVWVNSGGGKHHDGTVEHPIVIIGDAGGALRAGQYLQFERKERAISDAYLAVGQALGVEADVFGDPQTCKGPLPGLV